MTPCRVWVRQGRLGDTSCSSIFFRKHSKTFLRPGPIFGVRLCRFEWEFDWDAGHAQMTARWGPRREQTTKCFGGARKKMSKNAENVKKTPENVEKLSKMAKKWRKNCEKTSKFYILIRKSPLFIHFFNIWPCTNFFLYLLPQIVEKKRVYNYSTSACLLNVHISILCRQYFVGVHRGLLSTVGVSTAPKKNSLMCGPTKAGELVHNHFLQPETQAGLDKRARASSTISTILRTRP
jgi:hypothetical protein